MNKKEIEVEETKDEKIIELDDKELSNIIGGGPLAPPRKKKKTDDS